MASSIAEQHLFPDDTVRQQQVDVAPATALLELDCKLLPDQNPQQFLSELATIINDDSIEITRIMGFTPAVSKTDTPPL